MPREIGLPQGKREDNGIQKHWDKRWKIRKFKISKIRLN